MARPQLREITLNPPGIWTGVDVRLLRRHLGITQTTMARILAVNRSTVAHWECGLLPPSDPCCRLLDILDSNPDAFGEGIRV